MYRFAPNPILDIRTVFDYTQVEHCLLFADRKELLWQAKDRQKEKIKTESFSKPVNPIAKTVPISTVGQREFRKAPSVHLEKVGCEAFL